MDEQRAEFEAWANGAGFNINRQDNDNYLYSATRGAWEAWQAATQRQEERIAELEAQVQALTMNAERYQFATAYTPPQGFGAGGSMPTDCIGTRGNTPPQDLGAISADAPEAKAAAVARMEVVRLVWGHQ